MCVNVQWVIFGGVKFSEKLERPLEIIFVVLNFVARFRVPNVDHEGVNIRDSKFRDVRVPTKITKFGTPRK